MKSFHVLVYSSLVFSLLLSSCTLRTTPTESLEPATELVTVDSAGPTVGSTMIWFDNSDLVYVTEGAFLMGGGGFDNPEHEVTLDGFWIYRNKVTNAMYRLCVTVGECTPPAEDEGTSLYTDPLLANRPIVNVNWEQALSYCEWMNAKSPTEAQWEKAARGPDGNLHPWGNDEPSCGLLNFRGCMGKTTDVLDYPNGMSFYEAFDMAGNAFEWVVDRYAADYYTVSPKLNPPGPETGELRSVRGSSFNSPADEVPSSRRFSLQPVEQREDLGFRCVVTDGVTAFAPFCQQVAFIPGDSGGGNSPSKDPLPTACVPPPPTLDPIAFCNNGNGSVNVTFPAGASIAQSGDAYTCGSVDEDTLNCTGPSGGTITVEVCTSCGDPGNDGSPEGIELEDCYQGFSLNPETGKCEYDGSGQPNPVGGCPPGGFFNEELQSCVLIGIPSKDCPSGYTFNPQSQCCTIAVLPPEEPSCPYHICAYPICRPEAEFDPATQLCYAKDANNYTESCAQFTVGLGTCGHGDGCKPPPNGCGRNALGVPLQWDPDTCSCK